MKFVFTDGENVCLYNDGEVTRQESAFINSYRNNIESIRRSKKWKQSGDGAVFRGEADFSDDDGASLESSLSGVCFINRDKVAYSFSISSTSGIYTKDFALEKDNEAHIINSAETTFSGIFCDCKNRVLACSVQRSGNNADVALFNLDNYDYKSVTCGDTMDEYPFISPEDSNKIYFSSRGVGRTPDGGFAGFSPSYLCLLDLDTMDITTVRESKSYNYVKPVVYGGEVYSIKTPVKERRGNPIIEIILIPYRLLQAIVSFIHVFIVAFTGKSVVSGGSGGSNPAKRKNKDDKQIFIDGNIVNLDKEIKHNSRKKDKDFGFIPLSWKLVDGSDNELFSGAADFDIDADGTIIVTNGKHVFAIKDGKKKKLCDCEYCVNVSCVHESLNSSSVFNL